MKKKTAAEKEIAGTLRKSREPAPVGVGGISETPAADYIKVKQKKYYDEILSHVEKNEALQNIDRFAISQAAYWLYCFEAAADAIEESGFLQVYHTGAIAGHPNVQLLTNASKQLETWMKKLGMTPADRESLSAFQRKPDQDSDPLADLIKL